ncbi:conserved domain protein [delta proteobacterium NaphS2]|nr:conserved domain protein [delta proteobacterium NaphS2]
MTCEKTITETLENQGWQRRFAAAEPRLTEAVEMYRELGFQVHVEPLPTQEKGPDEQAQEDETTCRACFAGYEDQYSIIFTRPAEGHDQSCSD